MSFGSKKFLGASVRGFNSGIGWNVGSPSTLTVQLVVDPRDGDVWTPVSEGTPVFFEFYDFRFSGLLQKHEKTGDVGGYPTYEVVCVDPREILEGAQVILGNYTSTVGTVKNLFNVYGYWESLGFGLSYSNEAGIPWFRVREGLLTLANLPVQGLGFGSALSYRGVTYGLDLSELPAPPDFYRVGGSLSIGLLELIAQICDDGGCDFFVELRGFVIKIRTVSRKNQPPLGTISALVDAATAGGTIVRSRVGVEARNETTSAFLVGGEVSDLHLTDSLTSFWGYDIVGAPILGQFGRLDLLDKDFSGQLKSALFANNKLCEIDRFQRPAGFRWPAFPIYMLVDNEIIQLTAQNLDDVYEIKRAQFGTTAAFHKKDAKVYLLWWAEYCDRMNLNASPVADIIGSVVYQCSTFELRLARANFESWAVYVSKFRKEIAERIGLLSPFNNMGGPGGAIGPGVKNDGVNFAKGAAIAGIQSDLHLRIQRFFEYVRGYADEYMGRKFAVSLPFILIKQDPETLKVAFSYEMTDGGYLPDGSAPLGLSPLNEDVFKTQDGRFRCFAVFNDLVNADFTQVSPQGTVIEDGGLYMEAQVETQVVFNPTPLAILTLQAPLLDMAADPVGGNEVMAGMMQMKPEQFQQLMKKTSFGNVGVRIAPPSRTPSAVAVPIKSNTVCYGPWFVAGAPGKVKFEQDASLVPWNYGGFDNMAAAGTARVIESVTNMNVSEAGSLEVAAPPTASLGDTLKAGGPNVTNLSVSFGTNGVTTSYSFQTYTPKPFLFGKGGTDRLKRLAQASMEIRRNLKSAIKQKAGRQEAIGNAARAAKVFMGNAPAAVKKQTPHDVLFSQVVQDTDPVDSARPGEETVPPTNFVRTGVSSVTYEEAVAFAQADEDEDYRATTVMSWAGLFRPFATQAGSAELLPAYKAPTSGFVVDLSQAGLDPWKGFGDMEVLTTGDTYGGLHAYRTRTVPSNARVFGLRGPLVVSGWGWDLEGAAVPGNGSGGFLADYLNHSEEWKAGPVDLMWDERRGVWTSHDVLKGTADQDILGSLGSGACTVYRNGTATSWHLVAYNFSDSSISSGTPVHLLFNVLDKSWYAASTAAGSSSPAGSGAGYRYQFHQPEFVVASGDTTTVRANWGTTAADVAYATSAGTSELFARSDHAHKHPVMASGDLHPEYALPSGAPNTVLHTTSSGTRAWLPAHSGYRYQFHQPEFVVASGDPTTVQANWGLSASLVDYVGGPGVSELFSRADHVHQHTVMPTGNLHPEYALPAGPTYSALCLNGGGAKAWERLPTVSGVVAGGSGLGSHGFFEALTPLHSGYRLMPDEPDRRWTLFLPNNVGASGQVLTVVVSTGDVLRTAWQTPASGGGGSAALLETFVGVGNNLNQLAPASGVAGNMRYFSNTLNLEGNLSAGVTIHQWGEATTGGATVWLAHSRGNTAPTGDTRHGDKVGTFGAKRHLTAIPVQSFYFDIYASGDGTAGYGVFRSYNGGETDLFSMDGTTGRCRAHSLSPSQLVGTDSFGSFISLAAGSGISIDGGIISVSGVGGGTVTSVAAAQPAAGLTITGSPITTAGTLTFALANDLLGLEGLSGSGIPVRTATDAWTTRGIEGTTNRVTVQHGEGIAGNPTVDISSAYAGQNTITTLGTVTTGTWDATAIGTTKGGHGQVTPYAGLNALTVKGANIASAATTDLAAATGHFVNITGTATITGFGTVAAGVEFTLVFTADGGTITHASSLVCPSSISISWLAGDTVKLMSEGGGNWRVVSYTRFDMTAGPTRATQAEQEAGTNTAVVVTPSVQHHHKSAAKGWCRFDGAATPASIDSSYNVTSLTDTAAGNYTVVWATDFSAAGNNCTVATCGQSGIRALADIVDETSASAGSTQVVTYNRSTGTLTDVNVVCVAAFGDQ